MNSEELIKFLVSERKRLGILQADIAKKMYKTQSAISKFESRTHCVKIEDLVSYAACLGLQLTFETKDKMKKLELENEKGEVVASVVAADMGVWITLEKQPGKPKLAFDVEKAGTGLMIYPNSENAVDSYPALAFAINDEDVMIQLNRPGKQMINVSLFEVLKNFA